MRRAKFSHGSIINGNKLCNICNEWKPLTSYHPNVVCQGGVVGTCKECSKIRVRSWYKNNRARRQEVANIANQKRKRDAVASKGDKCFDCGQSFPDCVYDFHHLDPSKKDVNPSKAFSSVKYKAELDKCILLCANCHRIRHFGLTERKDG